MFVIKKFRFHSKYSKVAKCFFPRIFKFLLKRFHFKNGFYLNNIWRKWNRFFNRLKKIHRHLLHFYRKFCLFLNWPSPASFSFIFCLFQTNMKIFTTNIYEKYPFSIQGWDSNPRPSDHESHPVTTRPGQFCLCEHSWCALFVPQYLFAKNWIKPKSNSRAAKYPNKLKGERWKQVGSGPNAKIHTAKYYESFKRMLKNQCDRIVFFL